MAPRKLLITGATGYIGGSVLTRLLAASDPLVKELTISALVRKHSQADTLQSLGVTPILFKDFDDSDLLIRVASEHDIVIHTAGSYYPNSAQVLVRGLAERQSSTGLEVHYIHTSGTSNLGDYPVTKRYLHPEGRVFSDREDIYSYLKEREALEPYPQRTTDITVIEDGEQTGVKTYILMCPTIYGIGSGAFNKLSIQVPTLMRRSIESGAAQYVGEGSGVWDHVHIEDLVDLYEIILAKILDGKEVESGRQGFYFNGTGTYSWLEAAQAIGRAGHELGAFVNSIPVSISLAEAGERWHGGNAQLTELGFASTAITSADRSRALGWQPTRARDDWEKSIKEEFRMILQEYKK